MKIHAIYSSSRLGFDDWFNSVMRMVQNLGIPASRCGGIYYEQSLTKAIEEHIQDDVDYLLIMDGDSWFLPGHIVMLHRALEKHRNYDCIVPVQIKRNSNQPLFCLSDEYNDKITIEQIRQRHLIIPLKSGHFGLSLFKKSIFQRIKKPWFWSRPDSNGSWHDGKIDADMWFWNQFNQAGFKIGLATDVFIGHLQLVCTFPDCIEHGYKPVHVMLNDLEAGNIPVHCFPS